MGDLDILSCSVSAEAVDRENCMFSAAHAEDDYGFSACDFGLIRTRTTMLVSVLVTNADATTILTLHWCSEFIAQGPL